MPCAGFSAKRNINKLVPLNDTHAKQIAWVRCQIWDLYADLKAYKTDPTLQNPTFQEEIRQRFRELCRTRTTYQTLGVCQASCRPQGSSQRSNWSQAPSVLRRVEPDFLGGFPVA